MELLRASVLGFCFGVRRAVELAEKAIVENKNCDVFSLGPLIHNEEYLKKLENSGLKIIEEDEIDSIPVNSVVIIRAHGVTPCVIERLELKKCRIIDATCPRVKASQKMVERYTSQNDFIILSGDKNHGEVIGIAGYAGKNFLLIQNLEEAKKLNFEEFKNQNVILMSQTTFSELEFSHIEEFLKTKINNFAVMNTICSATKERQEAVIELSKNVDGVLVIGGKTSANTKRLFQIAQKYNNNVALIQTQEDIPEEFRNFNSIGITAGASTPDELISQVEFSLRNQ